MDITSWRNEHNGASPDWTDIEQHLDRFLIGSEVPQNLVRYMEGWQIVRHYERLVEAGVSIDLSAVAETLDPYYLAQYVDELKRRGVDIDLDELLDIIPLGLVAAHLDPLVAAGASIDMSDLLDQLPPATLAFYINSLNAHGANLEPEDVLSRLPLEEIGEYADELAEAGLDMEHVCSVVGDSDDTGLRKRIRDWARENGYPSPGPSKFFARVDEATAFWRAHVKYRMDPNWEAYRPARKHHHHVDAAKVRAWAQENGLDVGSRGRIRSEIIEAYNASVLTGL